MERSRIPRTTAMEWSSVYFFRAYRFAFVRPHVRHKTTIGMAVHLVIRAGRVKKFLTVFEGAPEAAVVPPSLCVTDPRTSTNTHLFSLKPESTRHRRCDFLNHRYHNRRETSFVN
ncbi:unnamed protein product [Haemonchus placei]|uniref:Uncharacterized protein n=1 Tax=Haemonchus placei TaxID=6290 RepID=A0A3P7Z0K0_HAEPC|nr:unnamed protein product [Haemonchus placei]